MMGGWVQVTMDRDEIGVREKRIEACHIDAALTDKDMIDFKDVRAPDLHAKGTRTSRNRPANIAQPNEFNKFVPGKVGTNIECTIVWKGNLGPSISAVPVGHSSAKAGLNVTGDRSAIHKLSILLTPTPEEKPSGKARVEEQIQRDLLNQTLRSEDNADNIQ